MTIGGCLRALVGLLCSWRPARSARKRCSSGSHGRISLTPAPAPMSRPSHSRARTVGCRVSPSTCRPDRTRPRASARPRHRDAPPSRYLAVARPRHRERRDRDRVRDHHAHLGTRGQDRLQHSLLRERHRILALRTTARSVQDLDARPIGVPQGSTTLYIVRKVVPGIVPIEVDDMNVGLAMLERGELAGLANIGIVLLALIENSKQKINSCCCHAPGRAVLRVDGLHAAAERLRPGGISSTVRLRRCSRASTSIEANIMRSTIAGSALPATFSILSTVRSHVASPAHACGSTDQ